MKVKVCGITTIFDALLCECSGADALGFIFYKKSKRYIKPSHAAEIIRGLNPFTMKVGVFVDEEAGTVNKIAKEAGLNSVQLHGSETPGYISGIKYPVIKGFRVNEAFDFSKIKKYGDVPLLLDAFSAKEYGGTGCSFNWSLIPDSIKHSIILAGGISAENINEIAYKIKPAAIDLSSSLELEPGRKDPEKVMNFFNKLISIRRK